MVILEAVDLEWISGPADDPNDQCSHGKCNFHVNGITFIYIEDGEWSLTAAALYLLRTLEYDHTPDNRVSMNYLIPCCAHDLYLTNEDDEDNKFGIYSVGCNTGIDVWVKHKQDLVEFNLDKKIAEISNQDWRKSVCGFVDQILKFYKQHAKKSIIEDPHLRKGWEALWKEISMRRAKY